MKDENTKQTIEERCNCGAMIRTVSKKIWKQWRVDHQHFIPYGDDSIYSGSASLERRGTTTKLGFSAE